MLLNIIPSKSKNKNDILDNNFIDSKNKQIKPYVEYKTDNITNEFDRKLRKLNINNKDIRHHKALFTVYI